MFIGATVARRRYFTHIVERSDPELLVLETDRCLFEDPAFKCGMLALRLLLAMHVAAAAACVLWHDEPQPPVVLHARWAC
jgi:hypothetical protein